MKRIDIYTCEISPKGECNKTPIFGCGECPIARKEIAIRFSKNGFSGRKVLLFGDKDTLAGVVIDDGSVPPVIIPNCLGRIIEVKKGKCSGSMDYSLDVYEYLNKLGLL